MATGDLEIANGVMKIVGQRIQKQYEEVARLHNRLQKGDGTKISDRGVEIPTHLEGNYNHAWMQDGGDFPAGGSNVTKRAQVFFKNYAFSTRLTGTAMDAINSMEVGYVKGWLPHNLDETVSAGYKMANVYAWGNGNGALATISAGAVSGPTHTVAAGGNRYLRAGMRIQSTNGTVATGPTTIVNPRASSTTFTVSPDIATTTSDIIVASGSHNLAITGIRAMIDDTTDSPVLFQGLSRNTYTSYRATRINAAGAALDATHLRRMIGAGVHISTGEINRDALELWSHPAQTAAYVALGTSLRRFEGKTKSIEMGFTSYEYEGIGWIEDVDCPKDEIDAIDFSTMAKFVARDFAWDDRTGAVLRQVPSATSGIAYKDEYEAYWIGRYNYGCYRPNKNAWIDNLAVPTGH